MCKSAVQQLKSCQNQGFLQPQVVTLEFGHKSTRVGSLRFSMSLHEVPGDPERPGVPPRSLAVKGVVVPVGPGALEANV